MDRRSCFSSSTEGEDEQIDGVLQTSEDEGSDAYKTKHSWLHSSVWSLSVHSSRKPHQLSLRDYYFKLATVVTVTDVEFKGTWDGALHQLTKQWGQAPGKKVKNHLWNSYFVNAVPYACTHHSSRKPMNYILYIPLPVVHEQVATENWSRFQTHWSSYPHMTWTTFTTARSGILCSSKLTNTSPQLSSRICKIRSVSRQ